MELRYWCKFCGWNGLQTDIKEHKKLSGKPFPVCPGCGKHKQKVTDPRLSFTYNRSILTGYAKKVSE